MHFLGNLGIDLKLLVIQIVNFSLLLWFLTKFVYRPVIKMIEDDEIELKQVQKKLDLLEKKEKEFDENKIKEINRLKKRAEEIIVEAENIAKSIKKTAVRETQKEKNETIKQIHNRLKEIEDVEKNK